MTLLTRDQKSSLLTLVILNSLNETNLFAQFEVIAVCAVYMM